MTKKEKAKCKNYFSPVSYFEVALVESLTKAVSTTIPNIQISINTLTSSNPNLLIATAGSYGKCVKIPHKLLLKEWRFSEKSIEEVWRANEQMEETIQSLLCLQGTDTPTAKAR